MILTVQNILDKKNKTVVVISPHATVQEAIETMAKKNIGALPVVLNEKVVGIISERDYIRKAAPLRLLPWEIKVEDIMTKDVISAKKTDNIHVCMSTMSKNRIRHLPVKEKEQLAGIISITDVVRALRSFSFAANNADYLDFVD